jgi:hypothetical protein
LIPDTISLSEHELVAAGRYQIDLVPMLLVLIVGCLSRLPPDEELEVARDHGDDEIWIIDG